MNTISPPLSHGAPALAASPTGTLWVRFGALLQQVWDVLLELIRSPALPRAALLILPYAGVLVGFDVATRYGALTNAPLPTQLLLSSDGGFGEWLEYSMTASVAILLFVMWRRDRDVAYLTNGLFFVWLTIDNALQFHEDFGHWVAPAIAPFNFLPVGANDVGEASFFLMAGLVWLWGLGASIRHARLRPTLYSLLLAACIAGASVFGVIVDMMVVWGQQNPAIHEALTFTEDGGEFAMLIVSFLVAVAIYDTERRRRADA